MVNSQRQSLRPFTRDAIPVSPSTVSGQTVTVGGAVAGGTATGGGVDFTLASGTLSFAPGVSRQNNRISVVTHTSDADDQTIEVTLSNLSNPSNAALGAIAIHSHDPGQPKSSQRSRSVLPVRTAPRLCVSAKPTPVAIDQQRQ